MDMIPNLQRCSGWLVVVERNAVGKAQESIVKKLAQAQYTFSLDMSPHGRNVQIASVKCPVALKMPIHT